MISEPGLCEARDGVASESHGIEKGHPGGRGGNSLETGTIGQAGGQLWQEGPCAML